MVNRENSDRLGVQADLIQRLKSVPLPRISDDLVGVYASYPMMSIHPESVAGQVMGMLVEEHVKAVCHSCPGMVLLQNEPGLIGLHTPVESLRKHNRILRATSRFRYGLQVMHDVEVIGGSTFSHLYLVDQSKNRQAEFDVIARASDQYVWIESKTCFLNPDNSVSKFEEWTKGYGKDRNMIRRFLGSGVKINLLFAANPEFISGIQAVIESHEGACNCNICGFRNKGGLLVSMKVSDQEYLALERRLLEACPNPPVRYNRKSRLNNKKVIAENNPPPQSYGGYGTGDYQSDLENALYGDVQQIAPKKRRRR